MSNNESYQRTLFDDDNYKLEGAVQNGAKWPPTFTVKPHIREYNGYTRGYVRFITNTNIEGDRNNGNIEGELPIQDWARVGVLLEGLTGEDVTLKPIECYSRPFGRDRKPTKEDVLTARFHITVREGRVSICLIDAQSDTRAKIPFYFGLPRTRWPFTRQADKGEFLYNRAAAVAWWRTLDPQIAEGIRLLQEKAVANPTRKGDRGNSNSGSNTNSAPASNDMDDDLPF